MVSCAWYLHPYPQPPLARLHHVPAMFDSVQKSDAIAKAKAYLQPGLDQINAGDNLGSAIQFVRCSRPGRDGVEAAMA